MTTIPLLLFFASLPLVEASSQPVPQDGLGRATSVERARNPQRHADERAASPVKFVVDFPHDRDVVYRIVTEKTVVQKGQEKSPFKTSAGYTFRIRRTPGNSTDIHLAVQFERLEWTVSGAPKAQSLDTQLPVTARDSDELKFLRSLIGSRFDVTLTDRGGLVEIRGPSPANRSATTRRGDPGEMIAESQLRTLFRSIYNWVPSTPMRIGETWHRGDSIQLGIMTMTRNNVSTIERIVGPSVTVRSRIDVSSRSSGTTGDSNQPTGKIEQAKPGYATIVFHPSIGLLESLSADVSYEMHLKLPGKKPGKETTVVQYLTASTRVSMLPLEIANRRK